MLPAKDLNRILELAGKDLEQLRGARLFVTGGTGFIGKWLIESLVHANREMGLGVKATLLTRTPSDVLPPAPEITLLQGDIKTFPLPSAQFTHVIHGATEASARLNREAPLEMLATIVEGTRRTLDLAAHCGRIPFLLLSSGAVYGKQPGGLTHVPETYSGGPDPLDPDAVYGEGKRMAELLCAVYFREHGVQSKIARCFAFAGPHLPIDAHFAIGNFVRDRLRGGPICIGGDGTPRRSYLHAADLAVWLWRILVQGEANRPYNVGSERDYSIREIADAVAGDACMVEQATAPVAGAGASRYVPSTRRAARELGLLETYSLAACIESMIEWYRE